MMKNTANYQTNYEVMPNGEERFRMHFSDGSSYIRTEAASNSGWQNSHYHNSLREMFIVQAGWVIYAELIDDRLVLTKYSVGEHFVSTPGIAHNQYLSGNAITHCVKFGENINADWIAFPKLDEQTKKLSERQALKLTGEE